MPRQKASVKKTPTGMYTISAQPEKMFHRSSNVSNLPHDDKLIFEKFETMRRMKQLTDDDPIRRGVQFPILMLRLLGVLPVQASVTGESQVKLLSPIMLYSVVVVSVAVTGTVIMMNDRYWIMKDENTSFGDKVLETASIIFFFPVVLVPVTHWLESGKKARFINSWKSMQIEFQNVAGRPLYLDLVKSTRKMKFCTTFIVAVLTTMLFVVDRGFLWWQGLAFAYSVCLSAVTTGSWGILGKSLERVAENVMKEVNQCVQERGFHCASKIRQLKILWLQLSELTQEFGSALGYSYGSNLIIFFVQQVLAIYGLLSEMDRGFNLINISFAVSAVMFTYSIFVICDAGQLAREQITLFLEAISSNTPKITFCGFVEVNRRLVASLMSAMVTYLVVLLQFQMSTKQICPQICDSRSPSPHNISD